MTFGEVVDFKRIFVMKGKVASFEKSSLYWTRDFEEML